MKTNKKGGSNRKNGSNGRFSFLAVAFVAAAFALFSWLLPNPAPTAGDPAAADGGAAAENRPENASARDASRIPGGAGRGLSFATWNMEWFPSGWPEPQEPAVERRRIADAARGLRSIGVPDVLFVQEIRDAAICSNFISRLGGGLSLVVCSDFWMNPTNRSLQQLAVFSRLPCVASGSEPWVASDFVYPPRGFAWAVFDAGNRRVACFCVHLKSNYVPEGTDRERQEVLNRLKRELAAEQLVRRMNVIARKYASKDGAPPAIVVAGDFNMALEDERFAGEKTLRTLLEAGLRDAFEGIPESQRPTLPANQWYPAATFDHILHRGLGEPLARSVGSRIRTSDHCPVFAVFPAE